LCHSSILQNCLEKEAVLSRQNNQIIPLYQWGDPEYYWSLFYTYQGCYVEMSQESLLNKTQLHCNIDMSFRSSRERWWFIAISNCNSTRVISSNLRMQWLFRVFKLYDIISYFIRLFSSLPALLILVVSMITSEWLAIHPGRCNLSLSVIGAQSLHFGEGVFGSHSADFGSTSDNFGSKYLL
jgi:hypothetical protein